MACQRRVWTGDRSHRDTEHPALSNAMAATLSRRKARPGALPALVVAALLAAAAAAAEVAVPRFSVVPAESEALARGEGEVSGITVLVVADAIP
jgi:hypothetical protein